MGKSNNLHNDLKKFFYREKKINNLFEKDEIKILEDINDCFIKQIITDFSIFLKKDINVIFHNTKIELDNNSNIKNFRCINLIEIFPYKNQSFITFSSSFFSVIIDLLFGGNGDIQDKKNQAIDMTSTELWINKKITTLIIECLSKIYKNFFSLEIKFIKIKVLIDLKKVDFNSSELFVISSFYFKVNNKKIFFSILVPISIIKNLSRKKLISIHNNQELDIGINVLNSFSFKNLYNVELEIISKIIDLSISYKELRNLSVGDVLSIQKPDKIIGCIENKSIFFGKYKRFNAQSIIFIEEFINIESTQDKENTLMSNIEKNSDNEQLIDSKEKITKHKNVDVNSLSQKNIDNKNILLDTVVNITVELGKTRIKIKDFLKFSKGSMLILDKLTTESLDVFINGFLIASGEIVVLDKKYGLRITNIKNSLKTINVTS
ncbi:flagellar motor switch protein FliN [Buchnera aphidicola]|uniref:flagellar motor switch protein FliN n=1 Tax=Buchnera aphidicola TaxID=9 RepID=UPI00346464A7